MVIKTVFPNSIASSIGLKSGDRLLKINNRKVLDEIDYQFRFSSDFITISVEMNGALESFEIEKEYDDLLGVVFEDMKIRSCANDCVFCFVDQNPSNMRKGMYFRDGDYRLSYLHGHYITMTNMGQRELNRVVEQKLSPLYISIHVTDKDLRKKLFLYKKDDDVLKKIKFLTENGIELHAQIVLMPKLNDGQYLLNSLDDLYHFYPNLKTVSIVPVGLTRHREGLFQIQEVDKKYSDKVLIDRFKINRRYNTLSPFVVYSDEWFLISKMNVPNYSEFDFDLTENGVGLVSKFIENLNNDKKLFPKKIPQKKIITIITGDLIYDTFANHVLPELTKIENLKIQLKKVKNKFFGESVTVSGLLTGKDIIDQLKDHKLGDEVWVTERILNDEKTLTLDDMTVDEISLKLKVPLKLSGDSLLDLFK